MHHWTTRYGVGMFNKSKIEDLQQRVDELESENSKLAQLGTKTVLDLEKLKESLEADIVHLRDTSTKVATELADARAEIVETNDEVVLQEVGYYQFSTVLDTAVAYVERCQALRTVVKQFNRVGGGAIFGSTNWTVNGSKAAGQRMVNEVSKLMLRAYNAEVDDAMRTLKPYKLSSAVDRLNKVRMSIEKLGKTMTITVNPKYHALRIQELTLTADFLEKQAQEKEAEKAERERMKEEAIAQREYAAERARLEKELHHYEMLFTQAKAIGNEEAIAAAQSKMSEVQKSIQGVDDRAANIRAGYVYVISNVGSFGDGVVKIGLTRRLDYEDRIHELSNASVPFVFDVHAVIFSDDAVTLEHQLHRSFEPVRINRVNARKEFFRATPGEVKDQLEELADSHVLVFNETPEAIEWRISQNSKNETANDVPVLEGDVL